MKVSLDLTEEEVEHIISILNEGYDFDDYEEESMDAVNKVLKALGEDEEDLLQHPCDEED